MTAPGTPGLSPKPRCGVVGVDAKRKSCQPLGEQGGFDVNWMRTEIWG